MTAVVSGAAAMAIAGLFLLLAGGLTDAQPYRRATAPIGIWRGWSTQVRLRVSVGAAAGLVTTLFTGFVPALALVPALVVVLPVLLRDQPQPEIGLLEALDRWVRLLGASVRTGKSIADAVRSTSGQAPALIAGQVRGLIDRLEARWTLSAALQQMADEVDSADADAVLAALMLVGERGGVGASATLGALSDSLQDRLRAIREIAAERAKPQVVVRQVTMITLVAVTAGLLVSPSYFAPFRTPLGQLLMTVLGAGYLGSLVALKRLASPRRRERILIRSVAEVVDA